MFSCFCLRPDLPAPNTFTVSEKPHRAKLDQNEAAMDLPAPLKEELGRALAAGAWNRYPQPRDYLEAKTRLAGAVGVAPEQLALTVGADQVIQAAFLLADGPGRRARWFEPTYPYVALASRVTGTLGEGIVRGRLGLDAGSGNGYDTTVMARRVVDHPSEVHAQPRLVTCHGSKHAFQPWQRFAGVLARSAHMGQRS